jgi:parallel beta-helix repeat protein
MSSELTIRSLLSLPAVTISCALLHLSAQVSAPSPPRNVRVCQGVVCEPHISVSVFPGRSIQAAVDAAPPGTSFLIKTGVHRLQRVTPKDRNRFIGEAGAVLSGARVITGFDQQGGVWVVGGQTQQRRVHGECEAAYPRCHHPEELFVDDARMRHVESAGAVGSGTWFFDYAADRIYLGTDPTGRRVETSVIDAAFTGKASDVTIAGLTIEKYASDAQSGAIDGANGPGWTVEDNVIRWNHGAGVSLGPAMRVLDNHVLSNGQLGVGGGDNYAGIVIQGNEIAYNNEAGFNPAWEAGGTKFWATTNLLVRGNFVHHNRGLGLVADNDNNGMLYENNIVEDNHWAGIFHEISYAAVIRNNTVRRNGFSDPRGWYWGAGIAIAASPDVEVYGNLVEDNANGIVAIQQDRGVGALGPWLILNLWVHDNRVRMHVGQTGLVTDTGDMAIFRSRNNHFDRNSYFLGAEARYFTWMDDDRTEAEWRSYGQDTTGSFVRSSQPNAAVLSPTRIIEALWTPSHRARWQDVHH